MAEKWRDPRTAEDWAAWNGWIDTLRNPKPKRAPRRAADLPASHPGAGTTKVEAA